MMSGLTDGLLIVSPEGHQEYIRDLEEKAVPCMLVDVSATDRGVTVTHAKGVTLQRAICWDWVTDALLRETATYLRFPGSRGTNRR